MRCSSTPACILRWCLLSFVAHTVAPATEPSDGSASAVPNYAEIQRVIEWVQSYPEGYYNDKQVIRTAGPTRFHEDVGIGVFAADTIDKGELLARIPWKVVITDSDDEDFSDSELNCRTIYRLIQEFELGETSAYAPFVKYLQKAPLPHNPSTWSNGGKHMLEDILQGVLVFWKLPPHHPADWIDDDWIQGCNGEATDEAIRAVLTVLSRSDDEHLVPVYDLYNHASDDQGKNIGIDVSAEKGYQIYAKRKIEAGEQLAHSYFDSPSSSRDSSYGTPELFRDYGFLDDYPQKWTFITDSFYHDELELHITLADSIETVNTTTLPTNETTLQSKYTVTKLEWNNQTDAPYVLSLFLSHLARLYHGELTAGAEAWASARQTADIVPEIEWNAIVKYVNLSIITIANALYNINSTMATNPHPDSLYVDIPRCMNEFDDRCFLNQLYPILGHVSEFTLPRRVTCNTHRSLSFSSYKRMDHIVSEYQHIVFTRDQSDTGNSNTCMELDGIVQICDNYRPHYHEYAVNYAARYLSEFKRVAFIGGGDSMILQEVLKYPQLELVVGLELDQAVVRNSFEWFHTDPYFHDDRVEWWFGDATKSLMLLPKGYLNSFDFVMVDVSETGASLSVTDHLDIFNAMSLLVKPDGILVKNEPYFDQMSKAFDFAVDVHFYDCPMICDQSMIMGSNHLDFFRQVPLFDHHVENLILPEVADYPHKYYLWRDYKASDPNEDGSCDSLATAIEAQNSGEGVRKGKSEGMLVVVEVEKCTVPIDMIETILVDALKLLEYTSVTSENNSAQTADVVVVMSEGYVVARRWQGMAYVAIDICLWARFERMDDTRAAIVRGLGAGNSFEKGTVSSYRMVVSGMYGSKSWEEDVKLIGPDLTKHTRKCDTAETDITETGQSVEIRELADIADLVHDTSFLEETLDAFATLLIEDDSIVMVFCGIENEVCPSVVALEHIVGSDRVMAVHVCPEFATVGIETETKLDELHSCRQAIAKDAKQSLWTSQKQIGATVLDLKAPYAMARIYTSFWMSRRNVFQNTAVPVHLALLPNSTEDLWRRSAIKQMRRRLDVDPLTRSEVVVRPKNSKPSSPAFELSILTVDVRDTFPRISALEKTMAKALGEEFVVRAELLKGGYLEYLDDDTYNPVHFSQKDYDLSAAKQQLHDQHAMGRQTIFQFGRNESATDNSPNIEIILETTLTNLQFTVQSTAVYRDFGDGVVSAVRCFEGTAIAVWDGRDHMTVNLFEHNEARVLADRFMAHFLNVLGAGWMKELRDSMPRGFNKVINFNGDDSK